MNPVVDQQMPDVKKRGRSEAQELADLKRLCQLQSLKIKELRGSIMTANASKETPAPQEEKRPALLKLDNLYTFFQSSPTATNTLLGFPNWESFMAMARATNIVKSETGEKPDTWKPMFTPLQTLVLTVLRLRTGLELTVLSCLLGLKDHKQLSENLNRMIMRLAYALEPVISCPPREEVQRSHPANFIRDFPNVRVLLGTTEVKIEKVRDAAKQRATYSREKDTNTLKGLVGCDPNGRITFVSPLYGGAISDGELAQQSGVLELLHPGDGVMVDNGLRDIGAALPFDLEVHAPAHPDEPRSTTGRRNKVARARAHHATVLQRIKSLAYADSMWFVACAFVNMTRAPLRPAAADTSAAAAAR